MQIRLELLVASFLVIVDQAIKSLLLTTGFSYTVWLGSIGIWRNSGAVFSIPLPFYLTVGISVVAIVCLIYGWYYFSFIKKINNQLIRWGLVLLISGGISNLLDRLYNGAVIDFLAIDVAAVYLNIADLYIVGGSILVLTALYGGNRHKESTR